MKIDHVDADLRCFNSDKMDHWPAPPKLMNLSHVYFSLLPLAETCSGLPAFAHVILNSYP
jgi:hypothetical protein